MASFRVLSHRLPPPIHSWAPLDYRLPFYILAMMPWLILYLVVRTVLRSMRLLGGARRVNRSKRLRFWWHRWSLPRVWRR